MSGETGAARGPGPVVCTEGPRGLAARTLGRPAVAFASVGSTNAFLKENGAAYPHGTLCWTGRQTAGRGRLGRSWETDAGEALAMSLLFKPAALPTLPLAVGLAAAEALEHLTGEEFFVKWPNDLLCGGRKVCGILCESCLDEKGGFTVAGLGVNLLQSDAHFTRAGLPHAGSVAALTGRKLSPEETAAAVVNALEPRWLTLAREGFASLRGAYLARCLTVGRTVRVLSPDGVLRREGLAVGVADDGCLLVDGGAGPEPVNAGEVSVRGADGYV